MNFNLLQTFGIGNLVNNRRIQMLAGVIRPDGNSSSGGTITWTWLTPSTGHNYIFPNGQLGLDKAVISANGSSLRITFRKCKRVITFHCSTDETFARLGISLGASVGTETADINFYQSYGCYGGRLVGNGSSWTKTGDMSSFTFGTLNANQIYFRPPKPYGNTGTDAQNTGYWQSAVGNYVGTNVRTLKRVVSGLGSDFFGYQLLDNTGTPVVTNDSNDIVEIIANTPKFVTLNANSNDSNGFPGAIVFNTSSNVWIFALLEY